MMDSFRAAAGTNCDFVLDCAGKTTTSEAASIADRMEDFHLLWLDEPTADINAEAQASISKRSVTPVGFGRHFEENSRFQNILREDGIDVLRPGLTTTTVTNSRKAAALAETYYIAICPYHRGGPIAAAAGTHISACLPNSFIQETPFSTNAADQRMRQRISGWDEKPVDGFFALLEGPGLGLQVDDAALAEFTIAS
jgi:galactonate dehydratase